MCAVFWLAKLFFRTTCPVAGGSSARLSIGKATREEFDRFKVLHELWGKFIPVDLKTAISIRSTYSEYCQTWVCVHLFAVVGKEKGARAATGVGQDCHQEGCQEAANIKTRI